MLHNENRAWQFVYLFKHYKLLENEIWRHDIDYDIWLFHFAPVKSKVECFELCDNAYAKNYWTY